MRCAQCDVSPVRTQILVTLNVAQKWAVSTECNGWAMLYIGVNIFLQVDPHR